VLINQVLAQALCWVGGGVAGKRDVSWLVWTEAGRPHREEKGPKTPWKSCLSPVWLGKQSEGSFVRLGTARPPKPPCAAGGSCSSMAQSPSTPVSGQEHLSSGKSLPGSLIRKVNASP
jgi:hypothetical protein